MNICIKPIIASFFLSTFSLFSFDTTSIENNTFFNWPDLHRNIAEKRFEEAKKIIVNYPEQVGQTTPFEESLSLTNEPTPFYIFESYYGGKVKSIITLPPIKVKKSSILKNMNQDRVGKWHQGLNALEVAIETGAIDLAETILNMGIDLNDRFTDFDSSSFKVVNQRYYSPDIRLLEVSTSFVSPLYKAIVNQNPQMTQLLLDHGADSEFVQFSAILTVKHQQYQMVGGKVKPSCDETMPSCTLEDDEVARISAYREPMFSIAQILYGSKVSALEIASQQGNLNYETLRILISNRSPHKIEPDDISDELIEKFVRYSKHATSKNLLNAAFHVNDLSAFVSFLDFEDPKSVENVVLSHPEKDPENEYLYYLNEKLGVPNDPKSLKVQKEMYKYSSSTPDSLLKAAIQNDDLSAFIDALELGGDPKSIENLALAHPKTEYLYYLNEKLGVPNDPKSLRIQKKVYQYSQHRMPALHYAISQNDVEVANEIMRLYPDQITMIIMLNHNEPYGADLFPFLSSSPVINFNFMPFLRGQNVLEIAVENNCLEMVRLFLLLGFNPNQEFLRFKASSRGTDDEYSADYAREYHVQGDIITVLRIAEENNNIEMAELFREYGALPIARFFDICYRARGSNVFYNFRISGDLW